jgi:hypothetical protein
MSNKTITTSLFLLLMFSSGCSSLFEAIRKEYRNNYCNYDGAFALGVNDARENRSMRIKVAEDCDEQDKSIVSDGYRNGYKEGLATQKNINHNHFFN